MEKEFIFRCKTCRHEVYADDPKKLTLIKCPKCKSEDKDLLFECRKCQHHVYTDDPRRLLNYDCPQCGEEAIQLWVLFGEGYIDNPPPGIVYEKKS